MVAPTVPLDMQSLQLEGVALNVALLRAVTSVAVTRTTDGASTVVVECSDPRREVLNLPVIADPGVVTAHGRGSRRRQTTGVARHRSRTLGTSTLGADQVFLTFAGLAYVLVQVAVAPNTTTLTFEDSVVAQLRTYHGPMVSDRASVTRSEFMLRMAREAKIPARIQTDERIPKLSPAAALTAVPGYQDATVDPLSVDSNGDPTAAAPVVPATPGEQTTTPGSAGALTPAQIAGLLYGAGCPADRVPTYTAIALYESGGGNPLAVNHANTDGSTDYGLFQINSTHSDLLGAGDWRDPAANTAMAKSVSLGWTTYTPWSSYNSGVYAQYMPVGGAAAAAATATPSTATPSTGGTTDGVLNTGPSGGTTYVDSGKRGRVLGTGQWQRGTQAKPDETSWEAIVRLAQELNWRAFSDGQTLWVGSDAWLRARRGPPLAVRENTGGVEWFTGEWDPGKIDGNDLTLGTHAPWAGQTAQAVTTSRVGRLSGPWLCHGYTQNTADREAVAVTLSRAQDDVLGAVPTQAAAGTTVGGLTAGGEAATAVTAKVVAAAKSVLGTPYVSGGRAPGGFDCSGLTQWCWAQAGVTIPSTTYTQKAGLPAVAGTNWLPGDLLFYYEGEGGVAGPGHVGLYIGGGQVIHAPHPGDVVRYEDSGVMPYDGAARPA